MKTILRIILAISITILLVGLVNAQNMEFELYSNPTIYAKNCESCDVKNLKTYTNVKVFVIWTNNDGFDSLTNKIYLHLENDDEVFMQRIMSYQKEPFHYILSEKDIDKLMLSEVEYIELGVMGSGLKFREETRYRKGMYDPKKFINYFNEQ